MPSASKNKSKDRSAAKAVKEQPQVSSKPLGNGALASTYNLTSGKFHILEQSQCVPFQAAQSNGKHGTIDEIEEYSRSSHGTGEFDCSSNNGSCSGESEDQKGKPTGMAPRVESVPGCDIDKREKIRQKNERKHQRQKERRAQELHERCKGYLMSRKLEVLAQKLVAMGFSSEQATMALIANEGCLEESVAWLCNFDSSEESKQQVTADSQPEVNLKIDIADELAKIVAMEAKFKCTKQEVERAVITYEGDLEKAEEFLKAQKQEPATTPSNPEGPGDSSSFGSMQVLLAQSPNVRPQVNGWSSAGAQQMRRDEKDLNYTKLLVNGGGSHEAAGRGLQPLAAPVKPELGGQQLAIQADKRRLSTNSTPSISYSASIPLPGTVPQMKSEARHRTATSGVKNTMQNGSLREPVIVMQRPQSATAKQSIPFTSHSIFASEPSSRERHLNGTHGVDMMLNGGLGHGMRNMSLDNPTPAKQQFVLQNHSRSFGSNPMDLATPMWGSPWGSGGTSSSSFAASSSLGLFGGWSSSGLSSSLSPTDWRTGGSTPCDYTSIDWSLDTALLKTSVKSEWLSNTWSTMFMGGKSPRSSGNNGAVEFTGLQVHESRFPMDPAPSPGSYESSSFRRG